MSLDDGLPAKAIAREAQSAIDSAQSGRSGRDGPSRVELVILVTVQFAWVAALIYGVRRAIQVIG